MVRRIVDNASNAPTPRVHPGTSSPRHARLPSPERSGPHTHLSAVDGVDSQGVGEGAPGPLKGPLGARAGGKRPPARDSGDYSSRDIRSRSLPDFLDTTVATVVKPALR
ncbi:hypothetical protein MFU01_19430 [Myxococcus fulvus]|uniref:Uncharacterized protein n=1 Tax=Myxococcus fulvus TaxID=33 RepID=A0A511SYC1_MYXFU|nr:hypothetical protein MFU01_19430 [Myxococcus fulvus]